MVELTPPNRSEDLRYDESEEDVDKANPYASFVLLSWNLGQSSALPSSSGGSEQDVSYLAEGGDAYEAPRNR